MGLLGLRWCDVDGNELHVRHQLSRSGGLVPLKTKAGKRDVVLMPELTALLKRHRLAARYSQPGDPVFASRVGKPFPFRKVQRGMDAAVAQARFDPGKRQPTLHDLRHTFASLLIAQGLDVVFIARQLGTKTRRRRSWSTPTSSTGSGTARPSGLLSRPSLETSWKRLPETAHKIQKWKRLR
jgi:integrase